MAGESEERILQLEDAIRAALICLTLRDPDSAEVHLRRVLGEDEAA